MEKFCTAGQATNDKMALRIARWITMATLSHSEQAYVILLFYCNNGCTNTPQYYIDTYIACIVWVAFVQFL